MVRMAEMIVSQAPLNMKVQMLPVIGDGPGAPGERGDEFAQDQVGTLDKSSLHQAAEGQGP